MYLSRFLALCMLEKNRAIVNAISNTCAFPTMTSQNVCCGKGEQIPEQELRRCFFYHHFREHIYSSAIRIDHDPSQHEQHKCN